MKIKPIQSGSDGFPSPHKDRQGPLLAGFLSVALLGLCAAAYWQGGGSLDAIRFIDRLMIRISVVLFSLSFTASTLVSLFPSAATRWMLGHRRNFTISFAVAFALHLCAIAGFYTLDESLFWSVSPLFLIVLRGVGVVFIVLILVQSLTSVGPGIWKSLTAFGGYYVWGAFFSGFAKRIAQDPFYLVPVALLILVLVLRVVSVMRRTSSDSRSADAAR